ncbi:hypothetical protein [Hymenobacter edaphi]|uniref:Uncharacterized protein n=1 Tax=Hymenobacter edaphi TaxID=2211146 RepID=A0A328BFM9_9BACT|nr:hypothetical protein [Hymenobacter edaphi]RAK64686.1 hypothetical protein DLM85_18560 [Hymenobacter edaphi]
MGALLTGLRRGSLGLLLTLSLSALRCGRDDCNDVQILQLAAPYTSYFGRFQSARVVPASSSSGLTDSYTDVYVATYGAAFPMPEPRGCTSYQSLGRSLRYRPSLYHRSFVVSVAQYPNGPMLIVEEQLSPGANSTSELYYRLAEQRPDPVQYYDPATQRTEQYADLPDAQTLLSLTVAGRSYQQVLRLTNPYAARNGAASAAVVYYVSPEYGLLRFEQRDGTVWDLTP